MKLGTFFTLIVFLGNAVLKLHTHTHFHLVYCIFATVIVSFSVLLDGV